MHKRGLPADFEIITDPKEPTKLGDWYFSPIFNIWDDDASFLFDASPIPNHAFNRGYRLARKENP